MRERLLRWLDTRSLIYLVIGIAASIAIGFVGYRVTAKDSELSIILRSSTPLVSPGAGESENIRILFGDREVDELWLTSFSLMNTGDIPIRKADYEEPVKLRLDGGDILARRPGETSPPDVKFEVIIVTSTVHEVHVKPVLLNPGDSVSRVSMVSENVGLSGQRKCHLYCSR